MCGCILNPERQVDDKVGDKVRSYSILPGKTSKLQAAAGTTPSERPQSHAPKLPSPLVCACLSHRVLPTRFILVVQVQLQKMFLFEKRRHQAKGLRFPRYHFLRSQRVSTSRYGIGQTAHSNQTPLGLHRIAEKIGAGHPQGTAFKNRKPVGLIWKNKTKAAIVHRILWLEGLQPGFNRGNDVDTQARYIYIHGVSDELTLGRTVSHGCIHLAAVDLLPLYDLLSVGTLVWIAEI
jgi:L,D-transpeptidase YbiS